MARIRTIKPEIWTDPDFIDLSLSARLFLIASLNFASDYGVLPDKPRQLKMQCLPADNVDIDAIIDELLTLKFMFRVVAPNGDKVLVIRTFAKNQKVNRPSPGRWGDPAKWPNPQPQLEGNSVKSHGVFSEAHPPEGKGRDNSEGKGTVSSSTNTIQQSYPQPVDDDDDFQKAIDAIVDARCEGRTMSNPRAYRAAVRAEVLEQDGDTVALHLAAGATPDNAARVAMWPNPTRPVPWCDDTCPTCHGDAWIDAGNGGLEPCPERTERNPE